MEEETLAIAEAIAEKIRRTIREYLRLVPVGERRAAEEEVIKLITKEKTNGTV